MKRLIFISVLAITLFSISCTKDTGGNADMSTVDFIVQSSDWVEYGTAGEPGFGYAVDLDFPEITNNVIENGMVTLYMKIGESWTSVPFNYFYSDYQGGYFYSMKFNTLSIDYYESDHQTLNPGTQIFRLVIVQPR
ncbi:MAG: hypothetical protein WC780_09975 [Lentimicrobiaceae bacterium]|jgi:hypothetical protein